MSHNKYLLEEANFQAVGGATGDRVSLKEADRVSVLFSTAGAASFDLKQHNAAAGGTTKPLEVENAVVYYKKAADTVWTRYDIKFDDPATPPTDNIDVTAELGGAGLVCLEILAEDLDTNNGFTHFSVDGAAGGFYVYRGTRTLPAYRAKVVG